MKVLVLNCGSSSLKYQFFNMENEEVLAKGVVERIGINGSALKHQSTGKEKVTIEKDMEDHNAAIKLVLESIVDKEYGVLKSLDEIDAIGHRVVHGGEKFSNSSLINNKVMEAIKECISLAPLHNPPNVMGIEACQNIMGKVSQVAVFDTAFHQSMAKKAFLYGLPYEYYEKYGIRKYGFHGTSHKYVAQRAASLMERPVEDLKLITCHLGNGSSIAAIGNGKSQDTSMGFTPLEGLVMGTRCGDIDPAIVPFIMDKENLNIDQINSVLNKQSGVLGISQLSSDFRDLEEASEKGEEKAKLALEKFVYEVKKYIGAYQSVLGNVDAIVFTAGVGENSTYIREKVCEGLEPLGIILDIKANNIRGEEKSVSAGGSQTKIFIIPTNEELMIARETKAIVK